MKTCRKCSIEKPLTEFYKNKAMKDGLQKKCKHCTLQYYQDNKQKVLQYYKDNPEVSKKAVSKYYQANKEKVQDTIKSWRNDIQGVYSIWENGKCLYVGESRILKQRISQHKWLLKNPEKAGSHSLLYYNLQQHTHLIFGIIEECDNHKERESVYINMYNPLYNNI